jgi:hypothetical protein
MAKSEIQWDGANFGALYFSIHEDFAPGQYRNLVELWQSTTLLKWQDIGAIQKLKINELEVWLSVDLRAEFWLIVETDELEIKFE